MTYCNSCKETEDGSGGGGCGEENCCWARGRAVKKFKRRVLTKYIFEVIFDVVVSVLSVVTDIISIGLSIQKGRWTIAVVTAIPVLLPTIIFTNVYLQDETQGYCKLPKPHHRKPAAERVSECDDKESTLATSTTATTAQTSSRETTMEQFHSKLDFHCGTCHMLCVSCSGCWGGMLRSVCYKDQASRDNESRTVKRSIKRLLKYIFGTFVLRYISLAWYAKAFIFGVRAYRQPKKYMKMALPNTHWGYDLLVKLDFLQAALENAPQCIVQLYVLLVYSDENQILGIITLLFSFVDFVRVSVSVQWDIRKGPVIAPSGCYKTIWWKLMNMSSIGRSAALALVIATAKSWSIAIPVIFMIFHSILFTKLFSKERYGLAAQKIFVSVFISIFFLPEFDTLELPVLTQLYYAVIHIENLFFIVPWNGMNYEYCLGNFNLGSGFRPGFGSRPKNDLNSTLEIENSTSAKDIETHATDVSDHCFIDPTIIVIAVPVLTMIGIVTRLAASRKMSEFKKTIPPRDDKMQMEERIANLYSKKWSTMTFNVLLKSFLKMLRNEVIQPDETPTTPCDDNNATTEKPVFIISPSFNEQFTASHSFLRAMSFLPGLSKEGGPPPPEGSVKTKRSMSVDACGISQNHGRTNLYTENWVDLGRNYALPGGGGDHLLGVNHGDIRKRSKSQDDINLDKNLNHPDGRFTNNDSSDMTWM